MLMVLGACSLSENEEAFFKSVQGKSVYLTNGDTLMGRFSSDGQIFTLIDLDSKDEAPFEFTRTLYIYRI